MEEQIEIEHKAMLTEEAFERLRKDLPFQTPPIQQINYYFETEDLALRAQGAALRIRKKAGHYTLTLKQPKGEGLLETKESLSEGEATQWIENKPTFTKGVGEQLKKMGILIEDLRYLGSLKTERYLHQDGDLFYMLDKSYYFDTIDYELEIEAPSLRLAKEAMAKLLDQYGIQERPALPKIARFYMEKEQQ